MQSNIYLFLFVAFCLTLAGCQSEPDRKTSHTPEKNRSVEQESHLHESRSTKTVSGRLSGYDCAVVGELCPTTHRGADYTTGVYTGDGTFYFVVNIPQSFLTQYFLDTVEVEGRVYPPYDHAVEPEVIRLVADGKRRPIYEAGYFIDENGQRATFQDGEFRNGRWRVR